MAEPLVIQKMDLCSLAQEVPCLDWPLQLNDSELNFTAPWRQARWMRDSLSPMSLPAGVVERGQLETAFKHIQVLHVFADRDL